MRAFLIAVTTAPLIAGAQPVFAKDETATARLAAPLAEAKSVIIDGRLWRCEQDRCTGAARRQTTPPRSECAKLAKAIGPVMAFSAGGKALNADQIKACNGQ